ncbi:MAG: D-Ala-D-Ala carboxypeptidase family metallohydrolase [Bacteroidales bacterium]|nr:D-Ala-D-Ala carboxypeptidase family metallohydrolase [Bacteroidales bacterium]MDY6002662.1 D-Ala-D-Ala carboxypeptidase family metallohydrolase [Candidatus Cryptobacteroides sp.]
MGTITKDFSYSEFEKSEIAEAKGITNVITTFEVRDAIKALVLTVLQPLRDAWGKPLYVNSGYRCDELNVAVGGVPTSQHVKGEAADIATDDPYSLANLAQDICLPYDQMILYPTFVHFSHKLQGQQRKQILYNKKYFGKKL